MRLAFCAAIHVEIQWQSSYCQPCDLHLVVLRAGTLLSWCKYGSTAVHSSAYYCQSRSSWALDHVLLAETGCSVGFRSSPHPYVVACKRQDAIQILGLN